jgi:hypothetical protein
VPNGLNEPAHVADSFEYQCFLRNKSGRLCLETNTPPFEGVSELNEPRCETLVLPLPRW